MNKTLNDNEKQAGMPFPSTVNSPCPNMDVQAVAREIVETEKDLANTLTSAGNVHAFVMPHYTDVSKGIYGVESLIKNILKSHGAEFPQGIENTEFRAVAVAASVLTETVLAEIKAVFTAGNIRYPYSTVAAFLGVYMMKKGIVGKIQLKASEDKDRSSNRPRCKWYLIAK